MNRDLAYYLGRGESEKVQQLAGAGLAFLLRAAAAAGLITDVGAIPSPFSPNADGVYDSTAVFYTLSDTAAVVVSVADSTMSEILMLWSGWEPLSPAFSGCP